MRTSPGLGFNCGSMKNPLHGGSSVGHSEIQKYMYAKYEEQIVKI